MYIIATKERKYGFNSNEQWYLGWQEPAWDEAGYFWTSKESIFGALKNRNNTSEHPFLFEIEKQAEEFAKKLEITNYSIETWQ